MITVWVQNNNVKNINSKRIWDDIFKGGKCDVHNHSFKLLHLNFKASFLWNINGHKNPGHVEISLTD